MIKSAWALLGWKGTLALLSSLALALTVWGQMRYTSGFNAGEASIEARVAAAQLEFQVKLAKVQATLTEQSEALDAATADKQSLIERIEDEARSDSNASDRVPTPDSVRRLEERWRGPR